VTLVEQVFDTLRHGGADRRNLICCLRLPVSIRRVHCSSFPGYIWYPGVMTIFIIFGLVFVLLLRLPISADQVRTARASVSYYIVAE